MSDLTCGVIDPVTRVTCGYKPPSGTKQGLAMHMTRTHGTGLSTNPKVVRDRERKAAKRAGETPAATNGSAPSVPAKQRVRARADLVLMVQLMYPNGVPTKDPSEISSFLSWCDDTEAGLLKRGSK